LERLVLHREPEDHHGTHQTMVQHRHQVGHQPDRFWVDDPRVLVDEAVDHPVALALGLLVVDPLLKDEQDDDHVGPASPMAAVAGELGDLKTTSTAVAYAKGEEVWAGPTATLGPTWHERELLAPHSHALLFRR
jgi:hypothetical protein